ncbi:LysM peptidoglycan-binding domain-containing protein [Frankia sp. CNm7]|nr:LysM peptidoglycan-binding domain-containing protein [Frankia nepalensis]MBL7514228.1 LysM peptidoglycan-binding domain-containing protein [Frankia nepalensis]MBL7518965.1 LysM peptidoglycan-binding domain-containing protein [Frankia nepalensis]
MPLTAGAAAGDRFPPHSRYAATEVATTTGADGTEWRYLRRRFIAGSDDAAAAIEHLVVAGERLDLLAARYYGNPLLGWRIADANGALDPAELTAEPGRVLRVPAPEATGGAGGLG